MKLPLTKFYENKPMKMAIAYDSKKININI